MIPVIAAERASILTYGEIEPHLVGTRINAYIESLKADGRIDAQRAAFATDALNASYGDTEAAQRALGWLQQATGVQQQPSGATMEDIEKALRERQGGLTNGAAAAPQGPPPKTGPTQGPPRPPRRVGVLTPTTAAVEQVGKEAGERVNKAKVQHEQDLADLRAAAADLRKKIRENEKGKTGLADQMREQLKQINAKIAKWSLPSKTP